MKIKAVIFDFNGTMIFDSPLHGEVWRAVGERLAGRPVSDEEMNLYVLGRDNTRIVRYFIKDADAATINAIAREKEAAYREMCLHDPVRFRLVDGLAEFLDYLKDNGIPTTIFTGSEIDNVTFFFEQLGLDRWFSIDRVIYDNGTFSGKPEPDGFLLAAKTLGTAPGDCMVFEDSRSGVTAAHNAGIGRVVAISETESAAYYVQSGGVFAAADNYRDFNKFLI